MRFLCEGFIIIVCVYAAHVLTLLSTMSQGENVAGAADNRASDNVSPSDLLSTRRGLAAWFRRRATHVKSAVAEKDSQAIHGHITALKDAFMKLSVIHNQLIESADDESIIETYEYFYDKYESIYIDTLTLGSEFKSKSEHHAKDENNAQLIEIFKQLSIPKLELEKFRGDPVSYQGFIAQFDELIASKLSDDSQKLSRLMQYCEGPALSAIRNCVLVQDNNGYRLARNILQTRFGNKHVIIENVMSNIIQGKVVQFGPEIEQLADELKAAISAVKSLKMMNEIDNQENIVKIINRCPQFLRNKWRDRALSHKIDKGDYPGIDVFACFLSECASNAVDPVYGFKFTGKAKPNVTRHTGNAVSLNSRANASGRRPHNLTVSHQSAIRCVNCFRDHTLDTCELFLSLSPSEKRSFLYRKRLCFNCMVSDKHRADKCPKPGCHCGVKHSTILHDAFNGSNQRVVVNEIPTVGANANVGTNSTRVYLPLVSVVVNGSRKVWALLDSGSTNSFCSEQLANDLKLERKQTGFAMTTLSQSSTLNTSLVSLDLKSVQNGFESKIQNLVILPKVSTRYPPLRVDFNKYPHLSGIPFDFTDGNIQADLLIGMDNAHLLAPLNVRHDPRGNAGPYAILTPLGWTLNGRFDCSSVMQSAVVNHVSLEKQVETLWSIDNRDYYTKPMSVTETHVLQLWDNKTEYIDGHYVVPVPWRDGCPSFPDNKFVAKRRLHSLVYQLHKSGRLDKYTHNVEKLLNDDHAELVPPSEIN